MSTCLESTFTDRIYEDRLEPDKIYIHLCELAKQVRAECAQQERVNRKPCHLCQRRDDYQLFCRGQEMRMDYCAFCGRKLELKEAHDDCGQEKITPMNSEVYGE